MEGSFIRAASCVFQVTAKEVRSGGPTASCLGVAPLFGEWLPATNPAAGGYAQNAITAHGGEQNLERAMIGRVKGNDAGQGISVTWDETYHFPGRFRKRVQGKGDGRSVNEIFVQNGNKAWWQGQDQIVETSPRGDEVGPFAAILSLLELRQRDWSETQSVKTKLQGRPVIGFELVERKTHLFFGPTTFLLSGFRVKTRIGDKENTREVLLSDYRDINGVRLPHKAEVMIEGMPLITTTITDVSLLEKAESGLFDRP